MSTASKEIRRQKAKLAAAHRHHPDEDHHVLKRDLAAATLEAWITEMVSKAPPFTREQRDRLAGLLQTDSRPVTGPPAILPSPSNFGGGGSTKSLDGGDAA